MTVIDEKTVRRLNKAGKLTDKDGKKLKPSTFKKSPKAPLSAEERTAQTLERICEEIAAVAKSNTGNLAILAQMISKINIEIPKMPEPPKKWEHVIVGRDGEGRVKTMMSRVVV